MERLKPDSRKEPIRATGIIYESPRVELSDSERLSRLRQEIKTFIPPEMCGSDPLVGEWEKKDREGGSGGHDNKSPDDVRTRRRETLRMARKACGLLDREDL